MKSRYLLGPATSPPDLRNHYCGRGYYSPSLRAVVYEPEANRPWAGIPSLRSEQIHPARYCASTVQVRDPAVARHAAQAVALRVGRTSSRSGPTVSRIMRVRSWSCLGLESPELLLTSNMLCGRRTLFPTAPIAFLHTNCYYGREW